MEQEKKLEWIIHPLLNWFEKEGRILPWRTEKKPYYIWLSEIMLQQTRIEAVKKYYDRFLEELPTIKDLAEVKEEKLLKLWEGLGYYNRARNLKKAAQIIVEQYAGAMPASYEQLLKLPGIGEYTAGAIASIAYHEKVPAVDGNVLRVISRITGSKQDILLPITKKQVTNQLKQIMPEEAGNFNEALMELGEIICLPNGEPLCTICPLKENCIAKKENLTSQIPVREVKIKRRKEEKTIIILQCGKKVAIQKRESKGLLAGMYQFLNIEGNLTKEEVIKYLIDNWNLKIEQIEEIGEYTHIFSHVEWKMKGYQMKVKQENSKLLWVEQKELEKQYPIPTAFQFFKKKIKI